MQHHSVMSHSYDLKQLDRQREYRKSRSQDPWDFFHKKVGYIEDILNEAHERISDSGILREINKQQIVSMVTALEVYLREMFILILDSEVLNINHIVAKYEKKFSLEEFIELHDKMNNDDVQLSEIITSEYSFQNIKSALDAFSKLLNCDVIRELKKVELSEAGEVTKLEPNFIKTLFEIITLRHSIIHDINFRKRPSKDKVEDYLSEIHYFVHVFDKYIWDQVFDENEDDEK